MSPLGTSKTPDAVAGLPSNASARANPAVAQFANDTTIHGLKDLYRVWNQNQLLKWTWILLLLASTGTMVYEMVQVLLNYLARPTATQIAQLYLDSYKYPTMLFCPRYWINATKVKALGMPKSVLAYGLSFLYLISVTPDPPIADFELTASELHRFMNKYQFGSYFDLYLNISDDSERTMTCSSCAAWPLRKWMAEDGVCYAIDLEPAKFSFAIENPPRITYNPAYAEDDADSWLPEYNSVHATEQFYVGYYPNDFYGVNAIKLSHNKSYVIKVTPTLRRRLSDHQLQPGGCYDTAVMKQLNRSQRMCHSDCEEWTYGPACWKAQYLGYSFDRPGRQRPPWFSSLTYVEPPEEEVDACEKREKPNYDLCAANCLPRCEEWIYDTTVVAVDGRRMWVDQDEAAITIVISYQVKSGTLAMEEVSTYTYHSFLSNIGGQLGLWLGASVLSIFQLAFFLVRLSHDRWKSDKTPRTRPSSGYDNPVAVTENGHNWIAGF